MKKEEIQCKQCFSMLVKIFGEELPKAKRQTYDCPACGKRLYGKRTQENITIRLNEK